MTENYYDILGVSETATDDQIRVAYRNLAKKYHPDINKDPNSELRFKQINEAYDTLKDTTKRQNYDNERNYRNFGGTRGFNNPDDFFFQDIFDFNTIFGKMHGRNGNFRQPPKNRDINLSYTISLYEAFTGKETEIKITKPNNEVQIIKIKIPPGINTGQKIRYMGHGDTSQTGIPPGDLYIHINISPDNKFIRHGNHLSTTIQIDYIDAILGTETMVQTIDGTNLKVKVPEKTSIGQTLRIPQRGMPIFENNTQRGDLMVEIIITPPNLTKEQLEILKQIKK